MNDLKDVSQRVLEYLKRKPELRDNREELLCWILWDDLKKYYGDPNKCTIKDFFRLMRDGNLSNVESVTRAWRGVQRENDGKDGRPYLRGKEYNQRHGIKQEEAKQVVRDKSTFTENNTLF